VATMHSILYMGRVPEGPSMDSIIETNTTKKKLK
jgi:hypothetical protein